MLPVPLWEGLPSVVPATAPGLGDVSLQPWQAVLFRSTVQLLRKASAKPYLTGYAETSSTTAIVSIARAKLQHRETLTVNIHQHPSSTFFCYQHSTTSTPHGSLRCATTSHASQKGATTPHARQDVPQPLMLVKMCHNPSCSPRSATISITSRGGFGGGTYGSPRCSTISITSRGV